MEESKVEARRMCQECPLHDYEISDLKLVTYWGELATRLEEKRQILGEARAAEATCTPDPHPTATALAQCFDRHEIGEYPLAID